MIKKICATITLVSFLLFDIIPVPFSFNSAQAAEFGRSTDFLIKTGVSLYDQGRFLEAMDQFNKALTVDPNSTVAKEFISQIQKEIYGAEQDKDLSRYLAIEDALNKTESKVDLLNKLSTEEKMLLEKQPSQIRKESKDVVSRESKKETPAKIVILDESLKPAQTNVNFEFEQDSAVVIRGSNIKRFLNNTPEKIEITKQDNNSVMVVAKGVGKGIFHIWDDSGRWTFDYTGKQKKFFNPLQEGYENMDSPIGLSDPFKITYSVDWNSFHTGRRLDETQRQTFSVGQSVTVRGETPYGKYDSSFNIGRLNDKSYAMDNLTMGLTDAHWGKLERVNLRLFDFNPNISAYKFPGADLRGVMANGPMLKDKVHYTAFWGGIPEGNYTRLSPGLGRTKEAYLEGIGLNYAATKNSKYKFYYVHSNGQELAQPVITNRAMGAGSFYKIGNFNINSEAAYDGKDHLSYTSNANWTIPHLNVYGGFTDDDRDFVSPLGGGPGGGSTSANLGFKFSPTRYFSFSNNVIATRNRNLYNPNDPKRPDYNWDTKATWNLDPHTDFELGYSRFDTRGSVSPGINETRKIDLRKRFFFLKKISTFFNYTNATSKYYTSSNSNYERDSVTGGLGFNLLGDLYYGISETLNFAENTITKETAKSRVMDTNLNYYSRIFDSPFYGRLRVSYRDEEETENIMSYLSGEDRIEFSGDLDYRPNPYVSGYLGCRVANVWAEKEGTAKHIDAEVKYGMRLAWDTGLRWNTKGHVYGFVFEDLNGDGIKDAEESGMEGISVVATTKKTDITDKEGCYQIRNIVGKKARVALELSTLPHGYTLTTPSHYDIDIIHNANKRLDFGLTTRAEIVGVVFVDTDNNNQYDRGEKGVSGVTFILDDKEKVTTDNNGQYLIRKVTPGEHTISVDLKTLPTQYIPKVPLKKKVVLEKGATFFHNIPLRTSFQSK